MKSLYRKYLFILTGLSLLLATSIPIGYEKARLSHFYFSHVVLLFASVIYLYFYPDKIKKAILEIRFIVFLVFLLIAWKIICSVFTPVPGRAHALYETVKSYLIPAFAALVLYTEAKNHPKIFFMAFYNAMIYSGVVFFVLSVLEVHFPYFIKDQILIEFRWRESLHFYFHNDKHNNGAGLFEHFSAFGTNQALCALLMLSRILHRKPSITSEFYKVLRLNWKEATLTGLFLIGIAYSTSKTSLVLFVIGAVFLIYYHRKNISKKVILVIFAFAFFAIAFGFFRKSASRINDKESTFFRLETGVENTGSVWSQEGIRQRILKLSHGREIPFQRSIQIFKEFPIRGLGTGQFSAYQIVKGMHPRFEHPHNIFLLQIAESGLIGLSVFVILICMVFIKARKSGGVFILLFGALLLSQLPEIFTAHILWYSSLFFSLIFLSSIHFVERIDTVHPDPPQERIGKKKKRTK